jgi:hypothetical protein
MSSVWECAKKAYKPLEVAGLILSSSRRNAERNGQRLSADLHRYLTPRSPSPSQCRPFLTQRLSPRRKSPLVNNVCRLRDVGSRIWLVDYNERCPHQGRWCFVRPAGSDSRGHCPKCVQASRPLVALRSTFASTVSPRYAKVRSAARRFTPLRFVSRRFAEPRPVL